MQEKHFNCDYPDLHINRGNVEYHMEHYEAAAKDFATAEKIDENSGCGENIKKIKGRIDFTKTSFQRVVQED